MPKFQNDQESSEKKIRIRNFYKIQSEKQLKNPKTTRKKLECQKKLRNVPIFFFKTTIQQKKIQDLLKNYKMCQNIKMKTNLQRKKN